MVMALQPPAGSTTAASQILIHDAAKEQVDSTNLITSGKLPDLTIMCQGDFHLVHKNIVCPRSKFLNDWVESGIEGPVDLLEDHPRTVNRFIQYLYTGDYEPKSYLMTPFDLTGNVNFPHTCGQVDRSRPIVGGVNDPECVLELCVHHKCREEECILDCDEFICTDCIRKAYGFQDLFIHAQVYEFAVNFSVAGLKDISKKNFETVCGYAWDQTEFVEAATSYVMPIGDKGLRDIIAKTICEHPELLHKPEIQDLIKEYKDLAVGIVEQKLHMGWNS